MKQSIRKQMRSVLSAMPAEAAAANSRKACESLVHLPEFRQASAVMVYLSIPDELDVSDAVLAAWQQDKKVLAPRVSWEHRHMVAIEISSLEAGLVKSSYGIREPAGGEPWPVEMIDLVIVPALAYDRLGNRLGRGAGLYDRFLSSPGFHAVTCGLAFAEQLVARVPVHSHDHPVDLLVTDEEVLRFARDVDPSKAPDPQAPQEA